MSALSRRSLRFTIWPALLLAGCGAGAEGEHEKGTAARKAGKYEEAKKHFEKATELNPELTEAWYDLGACNSRLAIQAAGEHRDAEALALLRKSVEDKKKARVLMNAGKFFVWKDARQQAQARSDVENALHDIETMINDDDLMLNALKIMR